MWKMYKNSRIQRPIYGLYAVLHEIFECSIQFAGIKKWQVGLTWDLCRPVKRAFSQSDDTLFWCGSPTVGALRGRLFNGEKLFDKAFVVAGAISISSSLEDPSGTVTGNLASLLAYHAPLCCALMPLNPTSSWQRL